MRTLTMCPKGTRFAQECLKFSQEYCIALDGVLVAISAGERGAYVFTCCQLSNEVVVFYIVRSFFVPSGSILPYAFITPQPRQFVV